MTITGGSSLTNDDHNYHETLSGAHIGRRSLVETCSTNSSYCSLDKTTDQEVLYTDPVGKRRDTMTNKHMAEVTAQRQQYQTFSNNDMLPPIILREKILYHPDPEAVASEPTPANDADLLIPSVPRGCCNDATPSCCPPPRSRNLQRQRRPPTYLQLYIKCERSEPFVNKDMDIVTWYVDRNNRGTVNRTLVVRGTTDMIKFIGGIVEAFGLSSSSNNGTEMGGVGEEDNGTFVCKKQKCNHDKSRSSLGCYNDICFVSDIKMTTCRKTNERRLIPLPIPGLYYKYIDRDASLQDSDGDSTGNRSKKNKNKEKKEEVNKCKKSSLLSTDPAGLQRTLVAQLLDKPVHPSAPSSSSACNINDNGGVRTRLALVYCTPKREARITRRSTYRGTLPPTIYHFQILLEGIVTEDDLPSSFQSQTSIRCVGAAGGVYGGVVVDAPEEIEELNRTLWKRMGPEGLNADRRDVIGLATPGPTREENLEQILPMLGVPLFDVVGNQTPRELLVDRCLYNIYSGRLSMEVARRAQDTMEAIENTSEWLVQQVGEFSRVLTDGAVACEDELISITFENEKLQEFDAVISKFAMGQTKWI